MNIIIGLIFTLGTVLGGYVLAHGKLAVLVVWPEYLAIIGMTVGAFVAGAPFSVVSKVVGEFPKIFKGSGITKQTYVELLGLLLTIFNVIRKEGVLGIEKDLSNPHESARFQNYPEILHNHHAMDLLVGSLRLFVDGVVNAFDLDKLMETEIETHHHEAEKAPEMLNETGDALPGVGIVVAVSGIIVTMQYVDGPPAEIGLHVAAALVGTFLGLLLAYGMVKPMATTLKCYLHDEHAVLLAIRGAVVSFAGGAPPQVALEFARKSIPSDHRPSAEEMEEIFQAARKS